jgi:hypothetical protein
MPHGEVAGKVRRRRDDLGMIGRLELERALDEVAAVNGELSPAAGDEAVEGQLRQLGLDPAAVWAIADRAALANVKAPFLRDGLEAVEEWSTQAGSIFALGLVVGIRASRAQVA